MRSGWKSLLSALLVSVILVGCGGGGAAQAPNQPNNGQSQAPSNNGNVLISGAGATFPQPIYEQWISAYTKDKAHVQINYQGIGSGGGIKQITAKTVDFGATDAPLTAEEAAEAPGLVHVPTVVGSIALAYHLPDYEGELRLTPENLAALWLGEITQWNDPRLVADNPGLATVDVEVTIVSRADGSGTTANFTEYLAKVSPAWADQVGNGKSVSWPVGIGGKGNEGIAGLVRQTPGSIGYLELAYAMKGGMTIATLKNQAGNWVVPTLESTSAAAASLGTDFTASISNSADPKAYPIASLTYLLLYQEPEDKAKAAELVDFIKWALTEGDDLAKELLYAPLPAAVEAEAIKVLESIQVK